MVPIAGLGALVTAMSATHAASEGGCLPLTYWCDAVGVSGEYLIPHRRQTVYAVQWLLSHLDCNTVRRGPGGFVLPVSCVWVVVSFV